MSSKNFIFITGELEGRKAGLFVNVSVIESIDSDGRIFFVWKDDKYTLAQSDAFGIIHNCHVSKNLLEELGKEVQAP